MSVPPKQVRSPLRGLPALISEVLLNEWKMGAEVARVFAYLGTPLTGFASRSATVAFPPSPGPITSCVLNLNPRE